MLYVQHVPRATQSQSVPRSKYMVMTCRTRSLAHTSSTGSTSGQRSYPCPCPCPSSSQHPAATRATQQPPCEGPAQKNEVVASAGACSAPCPKFSFISNSTIKLWEFDVITHGKKKRERRVFRDLIDSRMNIFTCNWLVLCRSRPVP